MYSANVIMRNIKYLGVILHDAKNHQRCPIVLHDNVMLCHQRNIGVRGRRIGQHVCFGGRIHRKSVRTGHNRGQQRPALLQLDVGADQGGAAQYRGGGLYERPDLAAAAARRARSRS